MHIQLLLLRLLIDLPLSGLEPVNVGNDDERSVEEIARAFARIAGVAYEPEFLPAREGDPQRRRPDLTRARSLGWSPTTPLEAGLRITFDWFAGQRVPAHP